MFFADRMLGKLAKKLRLLGFDTIYLPQIEEEKILQICKQNDRILITRDKTLHMRALKTGLISHLIHSDKWKDQLIELSMRFDLRNAHKMTRCSLCNAELVATSVEKIKDRVPLYIQDTQDNFFICPVCNKVYWAGSHVQHALEEFRRLKI